MGNEVKYVRDGEGGLEDLINASIDKRQTWQQACGLVVGLDECFDYTRQHRPVWNTDKAQELTVKLDYLADKFKNAWHVCSVIVMTDSDVLNCDPDIDLLAGSIQAVFGLRGVPVVIATKYMRAATWQYNDAQARSLARTNAERNKLAQYMFDS